MGCKYSKKTDEYYGYECTITGNSCIYVFPDKKRCSEEEYIEEENK